MQALSFPHFFSALSRLTLRAAAESLPSPAPAAADAAETAPETASIGIRWFTETFDQTLFGIYLWQGIVMAAALLAGMTLSRLAFVLLKRKGGTLAKKFGAEWLDKAASRLVVPVSLLAMAGALALTLPGLGLSEGPKATMSFVVRLLAILPCVWASYRGALIFCDRLEARARAGKSKIDRDFVPLIRRTLQVVILLIGLIFILQNLGVDVGSLIAGLGIGGLAIAMAAKDTLANFFGSLVLIGDRPFKIGDRIVVNGIDGDVESVGLRSTRVRTYYDSLVALPNSKLADSTIDNQGVRKFRRTSTTLGLSYDTTPEQMEAFIEGVRAIIRANEFTRKDSYEVSFTGFGAYSLEILLYFYVRNISWRVELKAKQDINLEIMRLAKALKVQFAFPTQTLHHEFVAAPGAPRTVDAPLSSEEMKRIIRGFAPGGAMSTPSTPVIDGEWTVGYDPREMTEDTQIATSGTETAASADSPAPKAAP